MVAALLKIVHTGIQDERLLPMRGQPALSFFKKAFIKAGRFTTSWVRLDFDTVPTLGASATVSLPRQGQLLSRLYLVTTMPDIATAQAAAAAVPGFLGPRFGWTNSLGHALLSEATIEIGGSRIESLNGRLLEVLDEFGTPLEKVTATNSLLCRKDNGFGVGSFGSTVGTPTQVVTPLPFWFANGDPGAVLPIDAISADLVRLKVTFAPLGSLYVSSAQQEYDPVAAVAGSAYYPLLGSPFYKADPAGSMVYGLGGNPTVSTLVSVIPSITMPTIFSLGDTYVMAEYIYLDKVEANRFRISDFQYPVVQHYSFDPFDSRGQSQLTALLRVPNPARDLYFYAQRLEAVAYNAPFLATRDLSGTDVPIAPWWSDAKGLSALVPGDYSPAFSTRDSEPIQSVRLVYEGKLTRYDTAAPSFFRSILPSLMQRKSPWLYRYYYNLSFGVQNGLFPPSLPSGEANLDKIQRVELQLGFKPMRGSINPNAVPRYNIYVFVQTYNVFRVYGGRAGLLFGY
jgi:hypothetical protein